MHTAESKMNTSLFIQKEISMEAFKQLQLLQMTDRSNM